MKCSCSKITCLEQSVSYLPLYFNVLALSHWALMRTLQTVKCAFLFIQLFMNIFCIPGTVLGNEKEQYLRKLQVSPSQDAHCPLRYKQTILVQYDKGSMRACLTPSRR